ncbi:HAD family hydrolase [Chitinimonas sp.]|uniref:HAD family hydrolase n=1 Tax=Chitinimonas sp. TaxID=1934313 RepID=UPI002F93BB72
MTAANQGMLPERFILDLDGTLIDSAPGILSTFEQVLAAHRITPVRPIDASLIGPPLKLALREMTGIGDEGQLVQLSDSFRHVYDHEGYKLSQPYPGIGDLLSKWRALGLPAYIVTNKREVPTLRILAYLGWEGLFERVYAIDSRTPAYENKTVALATLLRDCAIDPATSVYIGDTRSDEEASRANGLSFTGVAWGYGALVGEGVVEQVADLPYWGVA